MIDAVTCLQGLSEIGRIILIAQLLQILLIEEPYKDWHGNKTVIILDPPRKGVEIPVIDAVKGSKADKIIYVSCKPSTLARDVGLIVGTLLHDGAVIKKADAISSDYRVESVRPFDMFAQTKHVETICVLARTK